MKYDEMCALNWNLYAYASITRDIYCKILIYENEVLMKLMICLSVISVFFEAIIVNLSLLNLWLNGVIFVHLYGINYTNNCNYMFCHHHAYTFVVVLVLRVDAIFS
uniref:Uncharacterized protein n=1 Tax=Glossina brevipalpis TaxID=37001 RepID=A0A1A9W411_9MUSC